MDWGREKLFHALPSIQHQLTYFFFISSTILLIVAFAGDKWLTGLVLVSNESGTDWYTGFWKYCHKKHATDDGGGWVPGREQCYKIEILPHRGQFYIEIHDNIGIMNNVSHEMPLPGSCLQGRAPLMYFYLSLTIQCRGYILRILSETVYNILYQSQSVYFKQVLQNCEPTKVARIWTITALTISLLGGAIVWVPFLKSNVRWIYAAYSWLISTVLQILSDLIFVSVFYRLRRVDLPVLVNSERFPKFDLGPHFIVSMSSICSLFICVIFAAILAEFDIPRPYSPKRVFLKKIAKLKKIKEQQEEDERKIQERKQKEMKSKMKEIAKQKAALTKRTSALRKKNSMYGSSKGKSRKSNISRIRTSKHQSVMGKKASIRKSRIMHLKRLEQQA